MHQKTLDKLTLLHQRPEPVAVNSVPVPSVQDSAQRRDSEPSDEDDEEIIVYTPA